MRAWIEAGYALKIRRILTEESSFRKKIGIIIQNNLRTMLNRIYGLRNETRKDNCERLKN